MSYTVSSKLQSKDHGINHILKSNCKNILVMLDEVGIPNNKINIALYIVLVQNYPEERAANCSRAEY